MPDQSARPEQYRCRHIFTDGHRCGSPSLRHEHFCYYHHTTRQPAPRPRPLLPGEGDDFQLAMPEDRDAVQSSIGHVLQRLAAGQIDARRAALLLYGLQIASSNLPRSGEGATQAGPEPGPVEDIVLDQLLGPLALPGVPCTRRLYSDN